MTNPHISAAHDRLNKLGSHEFFTDDPAILEVQVAIAQALIGIGEELEEANRLRKLPDHPSPTISMRVLREAIREERRSVEIDEP